MKGLVRSQARAPAQRGDVKKLNIALSAVALSIVGASGIGFGSTVLRGLPEGNILFLGAVANLQFTKTDANATATFDGDFGIGTTPASDGTITAGDVDIIASTALGAATAGVSPALRGTNATQVIFDNTAGDLELNLNLLIDDAAISGTAVITASGFLSIAYIVLGDD